VQAVYVLQDPAQADLGHTERLAPQVLLFGHGHQVLEKKEIEVTA
jgi:hypothetical protein